jgi:hypothetical protein
MRAECDAPYGIPPGLNMYPDRREIGDSAQGDCTVVVSLSNKVGLGIHRNRSDWTIRVIEHSK